MPSSPGRSLKGAKHDFPPIPAGEVEDVARELVGMGVSLALLPFPAEMAMAGLGVCRGWWAAVGGWVVMGWW